MAKKQSNVEFLLAAPAHAMKTGIVFGRTVLSQSKEVFVPSQTSGEFVDRLQLEKPISDAEVAMSAIEAGRRLDVPELEYIGEAALTKALIRAETNPDIPKRVTEQVADTIEHAGVDPEMVPLLDDDDAVKAKGIMQSYDKVKHLFPNRPNAP